MKFLNHIDLSKNQLQNAVIHPLGTAPASPAEGQIYYNSTIGDKKLYLYDGTSFKVIGDITNVASTSTQLVVTGGTTGDASLALSIATAVTNGDTSLVTSDLLYDFINGGNIVNSIVAGSGITISGSTGAVTVSHTDTSAITNLVASGRTYVTGLSFDTFGHVTALTTATETVVDTNTYPTTFTWTEGTTAGPTGSLTGTSPTVSYAAIPSASGSASGIVTTNGQTFAGDKTFANNVVITGNLTVNGTTTTVNTETILLADNIITLNSNFTTGTPTENGGIEILRGTSATTSLVWNETSDRWTFTNDGTTFYNIPITGDTVSGSYAADLTATSGAQVITHNLGTLDVIVQLYDKVTFETLTADVVRTTTNTTTITFSSVPTNAVRVIVQK